MPYLISSSKVLPLKSSITAGFTNPAAIGPMVDHNYQTIVFMKLFMLASKKSSFHFSSIIEAEAVEMRQTNTRRSRSVLLAMIDFLFYSYLKITN